MNVGIYIRLLGFAVFTGATFNLAKFSMGYFSASSAAAWRFGLAAAAMLFILSIKEKLKVDSLKENLLIYLVLGIVGVFGFNALFFLGMKYTSPVNGALIMSTNPLMTTLLSFLILRDSISRRQGIGVILSLTGVVLVITGGSWVVIRTLSFSIGDIMVLLGNVCWALYGVLGKKFLKNSSPLSTTAYPMTVGALCLILAAVFSPNTVSLSEIPASAWGAVLFMAFFTSVLGYLWWNRGIEAIGAGKTSVFFNLVPVVTMVISFLMGMELTSVQIIGAVFVLGGVAAATGNWGGWKVDFSGSIRNRKSLYKVR